MDICRCGAPLRDTASPTRRLWCVRCGGATPFGRRLSLEETAQLVGQALSLLDRVLRDITLASEAVYGLQAPPESNGGGRPKGSHSSPAARIGRGDPGQPDHWADAATLTALSAQWVKTAVAMLVNADEAAGLALLKTDPHRGPADHVRAPYHDTIPTGRTDLADAHDAKRRRAERGEL